MSVVLERAGRWWIAELPSFPGAYSQGRTRAEACANLRSAIDDLLRAYAERDPSTWERLQRIGEKARAAVRDAARGT